MSKDTLAEAVAQALATIDLDNASPDDYYLSVVVLDELGTKETPLDNKMKDGLEKALFSSRRLSYRNNGEHFVDACRRYSRILFKYGDLKGASNFLGLASDLGSRQPGWVPNYQAKLAYSLESKKHFEDPGEVLGLIKKGYRDALYQSQSEAVFREFLIGARGYFFNAQHRDERATTAEEFKKKVQGFLAQHQRLVVAANHELWFEEEHIAPEFTESCEGVLAPLDVQSVDAIAIIELEETVESLSRKCEALLEENIKLQEQIAEINNERVDAVSPKDDSRKTQSNYPARFKILVAGASTIKLQEIHGIGKNFGLEKKHFEWVNEMKSKLLNPKNMQWNSPYAGILVGPIAHSVAGMGDNSSLLACLEGEGYPPTVAIRTKSGGLKITKTAFRDALERLLMHITATDTDVAAMAKV